MRFVPVRDARRSAEGRAAPADKPSRIFPGRMRLLRSGPSLHCSPLPDSGGQPPEGGTITGHVKLTTRVRGVPLPPTPISPARSTATSRGRSPEIKNVVVYLKDVAFKGALPASRQVVRAAERDRSLPRVLAITRGSTVDFPNGDPFLPQRLLALEARPRSTSAAIRRARARSSAFTKPGLVKVYCHIHSHMSASILVLDHPYFTVPRLDGSVRAARRARRAGTRSSAGTSASANAPARSRSSPAGPPRSTSRCRSRTSGEQLATAAGAPRQDADRHLRAAHAVAADCVCGGVLYASAFRCAHRSWATSNRASGCSRRRAPAAARAARAGGDARREPDAEGRRSTPISPKHRQRSRRTRATAHDHHARAREGRRARRSRRHRGGGHAAERRWPRQVRFAGSWPRGGVAVAGRRQRSPWRTASRTSAKTRSAS